MQRDDQRQVGDCTISELAEALVRKLQKEGHTLDAREVLHMTTTHIEPGKVEDLGDLLWD